MKDNIVLIGMPGVGKSTIGVILAKIIGYNFIDADLLIQESQNMLLKDIIEKKGVDGFIDIEDKVNASIDAKKTIIATGGSVVYGKNAMRHLKNIGTVIYLKLDLEALKARLNDISGRGVVLKNNQSIDELYIERTKLYEEYADITIDESGCNIEETVEKIKLVLFS